MAGKTDEINWNVCQIDARDVVGMRQLHNNS